MELTFFFFEGGGILNFKLIETEWKKKVICKFSLFQTNLTTLICILTISTFIQKVHNMINKTFNYI